MKRSTVYKFFEYVIGLVFILLMIGTATITKDIEIILPELGALTAGLWIYHETHWLNNPIKIFYIPSITAIIGFFINKLQIEYFQKVIILLFIMLIILYLTNSSLAPSFATGLLPIIVNAHKYSFIISILAFTFLLMLVAKLRKLDKKYSQEFTLNNNGIIFFFIISLSWIVIVSLLGKESMSAIPPILVVIFEVLQKPKYSGIMAIKQATALTLAATIGFFVHSIFASWLITTLISLPLVFLLLTILKIQLPAAYAFPLLAIVLPTNIFNNLPTTALIASAFFFSLAFTYQKVLSLKSSRQESLEEI
ncbi:hypothetical protein [Companilactobacillus sp. DQM5]|uniref:hypothetical protein n=1 Tax=Companilactobacillus sp. DQM5 TaxID=3463359 RepID=UPI0040584710